MIGKGGGVDVRALRHFVAVAEELHFGRAAERLGMTQPPLSQSIRALERDLGTSLFVRTNRSVALTPFGRQWLGPVRAALAGVDDLAPLARRLRDGESGRLDLSFVSTADYSILPRLVRRYAELCPGVEIALTEATSDVQIEALRAGRGHAGLIVAPGEGGLPRGLRYRRLLTEPLVAALPESWIAEGHVRLADGCLSAASVVAAPLVIFPRPLAPVFHDLVTAYYVRQGATAHIVQEAIQMQTIIGLVSAGMGLSLVPASLRNLARPGVRYVPLQGTAPTLETGIVWRADDSTATLSRFLGIVEKESSVPAKGPENCG